MFTNEKGTLCTHKPNRHKSKLVEGRLNQPKKLFHTQKNPSNCNAKNVKQNQLEIE